MKLLPAFLLATLCFAHPAFSQTSIPGGTVNGTWTLAGSPYNVQGSIQIPNGDSLLIAPGVTVNFTGTYKLLVSGRLKAIGTAADSITFTATDTANGWRGIRFDNTPSTNDSSRIMYCRVLYGRATGSAPENKGGALYFDNFSKAVISNSRISRCASNNGGDGIYVTSGSPVIRENLISRNLNGPMNLVATGAGIYLASGNALVSSNTISENNGGVYVLSGGPVIHNNTISGNNGTTLGGICLDGNTSALIEGNIILYNKASNGAAIQITGGNLVPTITNNLVSGNIATNRAGGIQVRANALVSGNMIVNNTAAVAGGIECYTAQATITRNFICNNTAQATGPAYSGGGGIWCVNGTATVNISNNVIANNFATNGGGILSYNGTPVFTNNTVVNNSAKNGAALLCTGSSCQFRNSILWGNRDSLGLNQVYLYDEPSDPVFINCDVQGGSAAFSLNGNFYTGTFTNNFSGDPLFVSPSAGAGTSYNGIAANWALQSGSPCIDSGSLTGPYPPSDITGNARIVGTRIDIGAYEWQPSTGISQQAGKTHITVYPNPSSGVFYVEMPGGAEAGTVEVYNLAGEKVFVSSYQSAYPGKVLIDLAGKASGVYFVRVMNGTAVMATGKVIKE